MGKAERAIHGPVYRIGMDSDPRETMPVGHGKLA